MTPVVRYTYTFAEYLALVKAQRERRFGRHAVAIKYGVITLLYLSAVIGSIVWKHGVEELEVLGEASVLLPVLKWLGLTLAFVLLVDVFFAQVVYRWAFRRHAAADKPLALTLTPAGIDWAGSHMHGSVGWPLVQQLLLTAHGLFIYLSKAEALVVPRRAFASEAEFQNVVRYAEEHVNAKAA